jgi:c-di-GMP-related signal transduction protein
MIQTMSRLNIRIVYNKILLGRLFDEISGRQQNPCLILPKFVDLSLLHDTILVSSTAWVPFPGKEDLRSYETEMVRMKTFMTKQPIFTRRMDVVAYEWIVRDSDLVPVFAEFGSERLTSQKKVFLQFCDNLIDNDFSRQLPRQLMVVDISDRLKTGGDMAAACRKLRELGYSLIADQNVFGPAFKPVLETVNVIKVDFRTIGGDLRKSVINQAEAAHRDIWATNVDTRRDFEEANALGCHYIEGYFFTELVVSPGSQLSATRGQYFRILSELARPEIEFDQLEGIIRHDVGFTYKLLQFVNSAAFGMRTTIHSIKQALVLLGKREIVEWVSTLAIREASVNKPRELAFLSIARGKFGELLAAKAGLEGRATDIFLMGMFSLIDCLLDRPLSEILAELPIADDVKEALSGNPNPLRDVYELILAYEKGYWAEIPPLAGKLGIPEEVVPELYFKAIFWTDEISRG